MGQLEWNMAGAGEGRPPDCAHRYGLWKPSRTMLPQMGQHLPICFIMAIDQPAPSRAKPSCTALATACDRLLAPSLRRSTFPRLRAVS